METDQVKKEMMRLAALEKEESSADQNHMSRNQHGPYVRGDTRVTMA